MYCSLKNTVHFTKTALILFSFSFFFTCGGPIHDSEIEVLIHPNVETVACLYNLTDIAAGMHYGYGSPPLRTETMKRFDDFKDHPAVTITAEFLERGIFEIPMWVAVNSSALPSARLMYELPVSFYERASAKNDIEDGKKIISEYLEKVSVFYEDARFAEFLDENEAQYDEIVKDVIKNLPPEGFIQTMEAYYGKTHENYVLIPSPVLLEFAGMGIATYSETGTTIHNVFGASIIRTVQEAVESGDRIFIPQRDYTFDNPERIYELSVHEFGHAFVNPAAEEYRVRINEYSRLYEPIREEMSALSYNDWFDCAAEHIVRAGEIQIAKTMGREDRAQELLDKYMNQYHFIYLPQVIDIIELYEHNRDIYPTIDDFFPELITMFGDIEQ